MKAPWKPKDKKVPKGGNPDGNGNNPQLEALHKAMKQQGDVLDAQGKILTAVVTHLQSQQQSQSPNMANLATPQEKRDLMQQVIRPSRDIAPSLSNIGTHMVYLLPMLDVIKANYQKPEDRPKDDDGKPLGFYEIWERSYYEHSKGKEGKHLVRLTGVAETQTEQRGLGIDAS